jgi:hypothetical protein
MNTVILPQASGAVRPQRSVPPHLTTPQLRVLTALPRSARDWRCDSCAWLLTHSDQHRGRVDRQLQSGASLARHRLAHVGCSTEPLFAHSMRERTAGLHLITARMQAIHGRLHERVWAALPAGALERSIGAGRQAVSGFVNASPRETYAQSRLAPR